MTNQNPKPKKWLTVRQVRVRFGDVSHMWVERRLKNDPGFRDCFVKFGRLRMADQAKLECWERQQATRATAKGKE